MIRHPITIIVIALDGKTLLTDIPAPERAGDDAEVEAMKFLRTCINIKPTTKRKL